MKRLVLAVVLTLTVAALQAVEWRGLEEGNYYSGPKQTDESLSGKVVLVDCWGVQCPPCRALLPRMEKIWQSFKSKPFVLVGSHCQGRQVEKVKELVEANKLTYPIYDSFGLASGAPSFNALPFMYVVNHRGKVVYSGRDEREATEALVTAISAIGAPPTLVPGIIFSKKHPYRSLEKQLVLGKPVANTVKKLKADIAKASAKNATAVQKRNAEVAESLLQAIEEAKSDIKEEIDFQKGANPAEALKLIKAFMTSFPTEGDVYKSEIPVLTQKAKEREAAKKAK